jgi:hypothetical protein
VVVIGAGSIGRRSPGASAPGSVVLADLHRENVDAADEVMRDAGFDVSTATVDVSSRESVYALVEKATKLRDVTGVIQAAGVSPTQVAPTRARRKQAKRRSSAEHSMVPFSVSRTDNKPRTRNGHIRNDTRDVSRRILEALLRIDLQEERCRE